MAKNSPSTLHTPPYDLIMLEIDDILPSLITPLALARTVPDPVCEMQTPALFTMVQIPPSHSLWTQLIMRG